MKQLKCLQHSPHIREYIMYNNAPIVSKLDVILFVFSCAASAVLYISCAESALRMQNLPWFALFFAPLLVKLFCLLLVVHQGNP